MSTEKENSDKMDARWEAQNQARLAALSRGARRTLALLVEAREVWSIHRRDNGGLVELKLSGDGLVALAALISSECFAGEDGES